MDIKHLKYFTAVVEADCNLLVASKKIFVSQPALSQTINQFEKDQKVRLFNRSSTRLQGLTPAGQQFYEQAKALLLDHQNMMEQLQANSLTLKGRVKIGIPPFILSTVFSQIMTRLIVDNPDLHIEIVELGAFDLRQTLLMGEVDMAVLLTPTALDSQQFEEHTLVRSSFAAFMDKNNPKATQKKLAWADMHEQPLAMINKSFMSHYQLHQAFEQHGVKPQVLIQSSNWDFLLMTVLGTQMMALLPSVVPAHFHSKQVVRREFEAPLPWECVLVKSQKQLYTRATGFIFNEILAHFKGE